jgi:hypothetical protein
MGQSESHGGFVSVVVTAATFLPSLLVVVIDEKDVAVDGRNDWMLENARVVLQMTVNGRNNQSGHFGAHSMLDGQHDGRDSGFD